MNQCKINNPRGSASKNYNTNCQGFKASSIENDMQHLHPALCLNDSDMKRYNHIPLVVLNNSTTMSFQISVRNKQLQFTSNAGADATVTLHPEQTFAITSLHPMELERGSYFPEYIFDHLNQVTTKMMKYRLQWLQTWQSVNLAWTFCTVEIFHTQASHFFMSVLILYRDLAPFKSLWLIWYLYVP